MRNVMTWQAALDAGFEPRNYPYAVAEIEEGDYRCRLDFKVWSKKVMAINCYFTVLCSDKKIQLTVYRRKDKIYALVGSELDMAESACEEIYDLVCVHKNGRVSLQQITMAN